MRKRKLDLRPETLRALVVGIVPVPAEQKVTEPKACVMSCLDCPP